MSCLEVEHHDYPIVIFNDIQITADNTLLVSSSIPITARITVDHRRADYSIDTSDSSRIKHMKTTMKTS